MDSMSNELRDLGDASSLELPKQVYDCSTAAFSTRSMIRGVSVGSQFRTSLQSLVSDLERTQPHYVRCIKPNLTKAPAKFLSGEVLKQLRYSGMMEAIRIRREGYAFREDHETFYHRFNVLLNGDDLDNGEGSGIAQLVKVLSKRLHVTNADWQIGHSKIFLRRELAEKLERLARLRVHVAARTLGRFGRRSAQKRVATFLVPWARFRLHMIQENRMRRAATKINSTARRYKSRKVFCLVRSGVVRLQAEQRRKLAMVRANEVRDPFFYVTFRECQELLRKEQSRLEEAVKKKNFRLAADLEAKM
jgi:myosin heavy subunit